MSAGTMALMYQEVTMVMVVVAAVMVAEEAEEAGAEAAGGEEVVDEGVTGHHAIRTEKIRMEMRQMERKLRLMAAVACRYAASVNVFVFFFSRSELHVQMAKLLQATRLGHAAYLHGYLTSCSCF